MSDELGTLELGILLRMEPKEVVDYFQAKGHAISWDWQETLHSAHARGFTAAKVTSLDVMTTLQDAVGQSIREGRTGRDFSRQLMPELKRLGWWGQTTVTHDNGQEQTVTLGSPWRLETIYRTNMTTAYQAGRYLQQMNQPERPYWQYIAVMDERTRASHAAMNGLVFAATDPIWQTHYPPNDWGCRCRVRAMSQMRLDANGLTVSSSDGSLSPHTVEFGESLVTGEVYETEVTTFSRTIDGEKVTMTPGPGWSYNVGSAAFGTDASVANKLVEMEDRNLRQQVIQALNGNPARGLAYRDWLAGVLAGRTDIAATMPVALLTDELATLASARLATLSQQGVARDAKALPDAQADYGQLPALLAAPEAVLRDELGQLVLVGPSGQGDVLAARLANSVEGSINAGVQLQRHSATQLATDVAEGRYTLVQGQLSGGE
jgi:SPP1 gp7 family putative phage head morphogenesis protein